MAAAQWMRSYQLREQKKKNNHELIFPASDFAPNHSEWFWLGVALFFSDCLL